MTDSTPATAASDDENTELDLDYTGWNRPTATAALTMPTQADVLAWVARRWPDRTTPIWRAGKLCEESGEVMGAVIKTDEGRKTAQDVAQETAQAVICCMALAESVGFDLWAEVAAEYARCQP